MTTVPFILAADQTLTFIFEGKHQVIRPSHQNYNEIMKALDDPGRLSGLLEVRPEINDLDFSLDHGIVTYKGEQLHGHVVDRLVQMSSLGLPYTGLMRFLANCKRNPRPQAVEELYLFLEHGGFPILPDGCFMGYKMVRDDYMDCHSGTYDNSPGKTVSMPRDEVTDDPDIACSAGLHVGTLEYVRAFRSSGRIVLVKVNPADVVSVPHDYSHQKLRACKYEVVSEYLDNSPINKPYAEYSEFSSVYEEDKLDKYLGGLGTDGWAKLLKEKCIIPEETKFGVDSKLNSFWYDFYNESLESGVPEYSNLSLKDLFILAEDFDILDESVEDKAELVYMLTTLWEDSCVDLEIDWEDLPKERSPVDIFMEYVRKEFQDNRAELIGTLLDCNLITTSYSVASVPSETLFNYLESSINKGTRDFSFLPNSALENFIENLDVEHLLVDYDYNENQLLQNEWPLGYSELADFVDEFNADNYLV